jgi:TPR repeat protein
MSAPATSFPPETSLPAESKGPAETITPESAVPESVAPESVAPKSITSESKEHEAQNRPATAEARRRTVVPPGTQQAAQKSPLLDATTSHQTVADLESSAPDLRLAQRYLGGTMGVRDPSEAAKLLWKAVSKQNIAAAVLLSNLYLRGDGVPRSCDQARLLLVAAAKRGSPLAAQQLRNLESQGCR